MPTRREVRTKQLKKQLVNLDRMIARAGRPQDEERFKTWRSQLIETMRKEGIKVPKTATKTEAKVKDCVAAGKAHHWVIRGPKGTCRNCPATRMFTPGFNVKDEHKKLVIDYIKAQPEGKRGAWSEFAHFVGISGGNLGKVVTAMLEDGTITEPGGKGSMVYQVVVAKGRAAAKKLYAEQRKVEEGSPKGRAPVSLEERREAKARRTRKAA